jgi:hypothetical protein
VSEGPALEVGGATLEFGVLASENEVLNHVGDLHAEASVRTPGSEAARFAALADSLLVLVSPYMAGRALRWRSLRAVLILAVLATTAFALVPAAGASSTAFSTKGFGVSERSGRVYYTLTICSSGKTSFEVQGAFKPVSRGVITPRPGSTQYQTSGCWPAQVSAPIASRVGSCAPISCAVQRGRWYEDSVVVTDQGTHASEHAPSRKFKA